MGDPLAELLPDIRVVSVIVKEDGSVDVDWDKFSPIELAGIADALEIYAQQQLENAIFPDEDEDA